MTSEFGRNIRVSIFGESHGPCVGVRMTGLPAGETVDLEALQRFLNRRAPGRSALTTARKETDVPQVIFGLHEGKTTGGPLCMQFQNSDVHSDDYKTFEQIPRPGHADYTARLRYGEEADLRGGGHFSGRLTAPLCAAGGIALQILERKGIRIGAHLKQVGTQKDRCWTDGVEDASCAGSGEDLTQRDRPCVSCASDEELEADLLRISENELPVLDASAGEGMKREILAAKAGLDSIGGAVECAVTGLPGGIGSPMFDGVENVLAKALFGIPAVKAVEFGAGTGYAAMKGSSANDAFCIKDGRIRTVTNNCGGILGGITDGMPLLFTVTFKPTPSIGRPQQSVDLPTMTETTLTITGRHDPCVAVRAVPVVEAAAALCILDMICDGVHGEEESLRSFDPQDDSSVIAGGAKDSETGLQDLRRQIDEINDEMVKLFRQRMDVSAQIAGCKREHGLPISDPAREQEILDRISAQAGGELAGYARRVFKTLFEVSREYQKETGDRK